MDPRKYRIERLENLAFYLRVKEELKTKQAGQWVAIAKSRIVATGSTIEGCLERANDEVADVEHRFVFQVGAERIRDRILKSPAPPGEGRCADLTACENNLINRIALGLLLKKEGGSITPDYPNKRTCLKLGEKTHCWKWQGQDTGDKGLDLGYVGFAECIEVVVDHPKTGLEKKTCALLDSGKIGIFMALEPKLFLDCAHTTEEPDDGEAETAGGKIRTRLGYISFKIPEIGYSKDLVAVSSAAKGIEEELKKRESGEED